jgi:hypothetical protein
VAAAVRRNSIGMHAVLLANAASLPAWMQLLHPVAAVIAKSKLLVLPAYPAAWPQAKKQAWVQAASVCAPFGGAAIAGGRQHIFASGPLYPPQLR